ncbi:MAG: hypothetical protein KJN65_06560 [Croceitalea sp.]|nr:hypothetical protein [Croceitalea sp.]
MNIWRIIVFNIFFGLIISNAQNKQVLYDFYEVPQALMLNPGMKTPYKWHTGIPLLSGTSVQAGTSGISVNDIFANDGIDITIKVREKAINGLNQNDDFGGSAQIELFNVGFRNGNSPSDYYSFGAYGEGFATVYWPRDLAVLAFEGNANNIGRRFNLDQLVSQGEAVSVFYFGLNRKLNNKWTVGARAKLYSSIFEFKSTNNDGYFVTTPGENNLLRNTLVADVTVKTSGIEGIYAVLDEDTITTQDDITTLLLKRALLGGNLGLGFDVGFTHSLDPNTILTASLLDVGFIYHTGDIKNYTLKGAATNEGIEIILPEDFGNLNDEIWQELVDDIEAQIPYETNSQSYISSRPTKLYASFRRNFGEPKLRAQDCDCDTAPALKTDTFDYLNAYGAQFFAIHRPRGPQMALTAFYQRRLGSILAVKTTYTLDKYSLGNIGFGLNLQAGPVNFYIMADNLLGYRNVPNSRYASLQFGFNIISWNGN